MNSLRIIRQISKCRQLPAVTAQRYMTTLKVKPQTNNASKSAKANEEDDDAPIQYIGSPAAAWRAKSTRSGGADEHLSYQPYVISGSLAIFLLYFCVFREENDIDLKLGGNLFDHVHGLEEVQLAVNYKYNKKYGLDNTAVIQRLKELGIDADEIESKVPEETLMAAKLN